CYSDPFARRLRCQLVSLALGLSRRLAFLPHEAKAAGHSKSAVDALSVPGVEQDLRGTIDESQRAAPRLLDRLGSSASSPAKESLALMVEFAWAYSLCLCPDQDLSIRAYRVTCRLKI